MKQRITDEMVEKAFDWIWKMSGPSGEAIAEKKRTEDYVKEVKAAIFMHMEGSIANRQALAEFDKRVVAANKDVAIAAGREFFMRCERKRCEITIEAWRTEQSSLRSLGALE